MNDTRSICIRLASDIIDASQEPDKTFSEQVSTELMRYKILYSKLHDLVPNITPEIFKSVIDETFCDGQINWGRIISVYALIADDSVKNKSELGCIIADKVAPWIDESGGWDAFIGINANDDSFWTFLKRSRLVKFVLTMTAAMWLYY